MNVTIKVSETTPASSIADMTLQGVTAEIAAATLRTLADTLDPPRAALRLPHTGITGARGTDWGLPHNSAADGTVKPPRERADIVADLD